MNVVSVDESVPLPTPPRIVADLAAEAVRRRIAARMFGVPEEPVFLGRFRVLRILGEGGMGRVYAAEDEKLGRVVALKVIRPGRFPPGSDERARLLREARALARLSHPNVVQVHDVGEHGDDLFITMEYVPGSTLDCWLQARPRRFAEILAVFVAAGRGLGAAHEVGIIHRDFKPTNVVVGDDGRARILDFGLARDHGEASGRSLAGSSEPKGDSAGAGTPAYMSPEQRGGRTDARSDQFSFCVAACEALLGARPSWSAKGRLLMPARSPRWLWRALARGLSLQPDKRFSAMPELLTALERGATRGRRFAAGAVGLASAVAAAAAGALLTAPPPPCRGVGAPLATVWPPDRRYMVQQSLMEDGAPAAGARQFVAEIDGYARRWLERRVDACEATRVRGERSEVAFDREMVCLDRGVRGLAGLIALLTTPGAGRRSAAPALLSTLPDPSSCADVESGVATRPSPEHQALRGRLDDARLLFLARRDGTALAPAESVLADSRRAGEATIEAEALLLIGRLQRWALRDGAQALATLHEAHARAVAAGHNALVWEIWNELAQVEARERGAPEEARRWLANARKACAGRASEPWIDAELRMTAAFIADAEGDAAAASRLHRESLALRDEDDPQRPLAARFVAGALADAGRPREAIELLTVMLAEHRAMLGVSHPLTAMVEHGLARIHVDLGEHATAIELLEHVREVMSSVYGPSSAQVAAAELLLSQALSESGPLDEAIARAEAAVAILGTKYPPTHVDRVGGLLLLVELYRRGERHEEALSVNRQLLELVDKYGLDLDVPGLLVNIGDYLCLLHRCGASLPYFARLSALLAERPADDQGLLSYSLQGLGHAHLERGEPRLALPLLEEARRLLAVHPEASRHIAAQTSRLLARCLRALARSPRRATALDAEAAAIERALESDHGDEE